jgi:hypothetical protein
LWVNLAKKRAWLGFAFMVLLCLTFLPMATADTGWSKTFGDPDATEEAYGVLATYDGGYVVGWVLELQLSR